VPDHSWRRIGAYVVVVVVACALLMLFTVVLDRHEDRTRSMYRDAVRMAQLQTDELHNGGALVESDLTHDDRVRVGRKSFRPSVGVRVQVVAHGDGYCVRGWNQHGDRTRWMCGDADSTP
jgi:hypothetical protein